MKSDDLLRERLKTEMANRGLSARELSLKAGLNESAVRKILHGQSGNPRYLTLLALAKVLRLPLASLTDPDGAPPTPEGLIDALTTESDVSQGDLEDKARSDLAAGQPRIPIAKPVRAFGAASTSSIDLSIQRRMTAVEMAMELTRGDPNRDVTSIIKAAAEIEKFLIEGDKAE